MLAVPPLFTGPCGPGALNRYETPKTPDTLRPDNGGVSGGYYLNCILHIVNCKLVMNLQFEICNLQSFRSATPRAIPRLRMRRLHTILPAL
jgi:hypothetical protein